MKLKLKHESRGWGTDNEVINTLKKYLSRGA